MLKNEPNDSFLNYALALEFAKENNIVLAIEMIEKLINTNPNYVGAYYQLGKLYEQLNNFNQAVFTYQKGIVVAKKLNQNKTAMELTQALNLLETDF
jgi:tetratricopeptide (TPR) repeat protein